MGSKSYSSSITDISDLRTVAEGENIVGPQATQATGGSLIAGEGATITITGAHGLDAGETFEQMVSSMNSTVGQALGISKQLAQGIFEEHAAAATPEGAAAIGGIPAGAAGGSNTLLIAGLVVLALLLLGGPK